MISYNDFSKSLDELGALTGTLIKKPQKDALYRVLNATAEVDFARAIVSLAESGERLSLNTLRRHINEQMAERLEKEERLRKQREEKETTEFWRAHFKEGRCMIHECGKCPKSFCNIVSNAAIKGIKDMLSGDRTSEEVHRELAEEFPGIRFEEHTGDEAF